MSDIEIKKKTIVPEERLKQDKTDEIEGTFANYSNKGEFSKALIVSDVIRKVIESRSKEMRSGYFNTTQTPDGREIKTWVPDARKEFIAAVDALTLTLAPEISTDSDIRTFVEEYEKSKEELFEKYCYHEVIYDWKKNDLFFNKNTFMPDIDFKVPYMQRREGGGTKRLNYEIGGWNQKVQQYWNELLEETDKLFMKLNILLHHIEYFNVSAGFG